MSFPFLLTNGRLLPTLLPSLPPFVRSSSPCLSKYTYYFSPSRHSLLNNHAEKYTRGRVYGKWRHAAG